MIGIVNAIGDVLLALSAAGTCYAVVAGGMVRRMFAKGPRAAGEATPATLLKPLCGDEPGLAENLESFARQDYGGAVQILLGVQDPSDPAVKIARRLREARPRADIEVVIDEQAHGANRKVSNLINLARHVRHELIVISDADIRVAPGYLGVLAGALDEPGIGAVSCLYVGEARTGLWSRLVAMGISYGFLPNAVMGLALGAAKPCMGSTIALRRSVLEEIGGFEAFADVLADDYEIGRAVRARGHGVAVPPYVVSHGCAERSLRELLAHELRWAVTIRSISAAGHVGSIVTHPVPLALLGTLLSGAAPVPLGLTFLAAALCARLWLMASVDRATGAKSGPWFLMPVRDLAAFVVFIASLFAASVDWRGVRFHVSSSRTVSAA